MKYTNIKYTNMKYTNIEYTNIKYTNIKYTNIKYTNIEHMFWYKSLKFRGTFTLVFWLACHTCVSTKYLGVGRIACTIRCLILFFCCNLILFFCTIFLIKQDTKMFAATRLKNLCAELSAGTHPSSHNLCLKVEVKLFHL